MLSEDDDILYYSNPDISQETYQRAWLASGHAQEEEFVFKLSGEKYLAVYILAERLSRLLIRLSEDIGLSTTGP